ncbi:MAG: tryptophan halogenase family protein [Allosphingosinicella sp.]
MGPKAISRIVIAGGGIVGWSAAAALKRRLPALEVTLLAVPPPPDALAERISSTLPSISGFHGDIGLGEADTVVRAGSGFRIGTRFDGWTGEGSSYVHAYGPYGQPFGTTSFHHHWLRARRDGLEAPFDAFSPAAAIGRAGRFVHPGSDPASPLAGVEYGLQLALLRYHQLLRAYGRHLGVAERPGAVAGVRLRSEDGFVEALALDDGSEIGGDLFIDCTGPAAAVRSALDTRFESWRRWLPCDRIRFAEAPPPGELPVLDRVAAHGAGWGWQAPSPARTSHGLVWASGALDEEAARRMLPGDDAPVALAAGRLAEPWLRNCVAVGDAAVAVEPLEWTNLHLAHSAIDRISSMLPDRDCAPIELAEYNRQAAAEADRVRDFLILHYRAARRPEPFWRDAAAVEPPGSLARTLALFEERGRLPFHEEETFSRESWLAVLLGQGIVPRRIDPLTDSVAPAAVEERMARMRAAIAALPATLPTHSDYIRHLSTRTQR